MAMFSILHRPLVRLLAMMVALTNVADSQGADYISSTPIAPSECSATLAAVIPSGLICNLGGRLAKPAFLGDVVEVTDTSYCAYLCEANALCLAFSITSGENAATTSPVRA